MMRKIIALMSLLLMPVFLLADADQIDLSDVKTHNGSAGRVSWDNGSILEFPNTGFSAKLFTEFRSRYEYMNYDDNTGLDSVSNFEVTNLRLGLAGDILNDEFSYFIKGALTDDEETTSDGADLLDAFIRWAPCDKGSVRMGQFKSAVGRGYQTLLVDMQFADRSIVSEQFSLGRQGGLEGTTTIGDLVIGGQILNGVEEGINAAGVNTDHTLVAYARLPLMGEIDSNVEGDVDSTDEAAADIGVAFANSDLGTDTDLTTISVDANVKSNGLSVMAELLYNEFDPAAGSDADSLGYYIQAGYFVMPKELEVAARYGTIDCDEVSTGYCAGNSDVSEVNVSVNYHWWAHHLKAQLGYSAYNEDTTAGTDNTNNAWVLNLSGAF